MSSERFCLFCDQPAESLSMYCFECGEEQTSARTGDTHIDEFLDEQYNGFVGPSRGWSQRQGEQFTPIEKVDEDGKWVEWTTATSEEYPSGPAAYESEVGFLKVRLPNDQYVDKYAVTLEQMREDGAV